MAVRDIVVVDDVVVVVVTEGNEVHAVDGGRGGLPLRLLVSNGERRRWSRSRAFIGVP